MANARSAESEHCRVTIHTINETPILRSVPSQVGASLLASLQRSTSYRCTSSDHFRTEGNKHVPIHRAREEG